MSNPFAQSMTRMKAPAGAGQSISVRGFTMEADADGVVLVPGDVANDLMSHGFTKAPAVEPEPKKK